MTTTTNHPAPESEREAIARMLKEQGFTSRDGTVINGGTYGVIDAILSRRMEAAPPDPACMRAVAENEPCKPTGDNHLRCSICGFIVDTSFEATKPTIDFTMQGRSKKTASPPAPPVPALDARTVEALIEFFKWSMRTGPWDGGDIDGASVQDRAQELGLIIKTQYDAEKHGVQSDFEHGDDWFEYSPILNLASAKDPSR